MPPPPSPHLTRASEASERLTAQTLKYDYEATAALADIPNQMMRTREHVQRMRDASMATRMRVDAANLKRQEFQQRMTEARQLNQFRSEKLLVDQQKQALDLAEYEAAQRKANMPDPRRAGPFYSELRKDKTTGQDYLPGLGGGKAKLTPEEANRYRTRQTQQRARDVEQQEAYTASLERRGQPKEPTELDTREQEVDIRLKEARTIKALGGTDTDVNESAVLRFLDMMLNRGTQDELGGRAWTYSPSFRAKMQDVIESEGRKLMDKLMQKKGKNGASATRSAKQREYDKLMEQIKALEAKQKK